MASASYTDETLRQSKCSPQKRQRRSNQVYSKLAEDLVAQFAKSRGWDILHRNFRRPGCELDIIMKKKKTLVVLEVKFRRQPIDLTTLIPKKKFEALVRGIERFLAIEVHEHDILRFDLAVVTLAKGKLTLAHYLPDFAHE